MDRVIAYDGALVQTLDVLNTNKFSLVGQAFLNRALLGTTTVVSGLVATPTSPTADLHVTVGVGSIYQLDPTDQTAYSDLGTDTNNIVKQGLLQQPVVLAITPPVTAGFSQVYLVEAILNDVDGGTQVLSYYNSIPPNVPFAGPANSGASNFTIRTNTCVIALKAGVAASTGTQVAPNADVGYVGLYTITVANGQTQITSGNIAALATAPFFPTLPQVPYQVQQGTYVYGGQDSGTANNYVVNFTAGQPIPTALTPGMGIKFKALNACTGASVINLQGLGNVAIRRATGVALAANDINSGQMVELTYDGTVFQMQNYLGAGATSNTSTVVGIPYVADTGATNAIVATYSPALVSGNLVAGLTIEVKLANTITGACTINPNGLGAKPVTLGDATNPPYNVFVAGEILLLIYDGTRFQIADTSAGMFYRQPTGNYSIYVNSSIGSDTLYDGTAASIGSGTSGPFKTIQKGINTAWSYAPSPFTITVNIAAGSYSENPVSPVWPASNILINGAGAGSTTLVAASAGTYCLTISGPTNVTIQNLCLAGNAAQGLVVLNSATVNVQNMIFDGQYSQGTHLWSLQGAVISVNGALSIGGNCSTVFNAQVGGSIQFGPSVPITILSGIGVTNGFVLAARAGDISVLQASPPIFNNPTFAVGPKYQAFGNGTIDAAGLGVNFFPGTSAGFTSTGGQYLG